MNALRERQTTGQSAIELVAGIILLVPIMLFLFDVMVLVLANQANDDVAKRACRAAANQTNVGDAETAAQQVVDEINAQYEKGGYIKKIIIQPYGNAKLKWDADQDGHIELRTQIQVQLPVPVPFVKADSVLLAAQAGETIVAIRAREE